MKQGWRGTGRFRFFAEKNGFLMHYQLLTTRTSKFQNDIFDFFRKEARDIRPRFGDYHVKIWVEHLDADPRIDVDNVAKACLDSLTKIVWMDDRQVKSLEVDKYQGSMDQVYLYARSLENPPNGSDLKSLLEKAP